MLLRVLIGRVNWYEWLVLAAFVALTLTVYIQMQRLKISQLELQNSKTAHEITSSELEFIRKTKQLDDVVTNKTLNEIEEIRNTVVEEGKKFHSDYTAVINNDVKKEIEEKQPNGNVSLETEVKPKAPSKIITAIDLGKKQNHEKTTEKTENTVDKIKSNHSDRARVKLIAGRLHNAWSCSSGITANCTT